MVTAGGGAGGKKVVVDGSCGIWSRGRCGWQKKVEVVSNCGMQSRLVGVGVIEKKVAVESTATFFYHPQCRWYFWYMIAAGGDADGKKR